MVAVVRQAGCSSLKLGEKMSSGAKQTSISAYYTMGSFVPRGTLGATAGLSNLTQICSVTGVLQNVMVVK